MAASVVPAPGRFSTMNALPSRASSFCVTSRASRSEPPPAANGTTTVTGRDGYCCACAGIATAASTPRIESEMTQSHRFPPALPLVIAAALRVLSFAEPQACSAPIIEFSIRRA